MEPRSTIINLIKGFIDLYGIKAEELGFNPKYTLEESFKKTIDWYKEMKWIK